MKKNTNLVFESIINLKNEGKLNISVTKYEISVIDIKECVFIKSNQGNISINKFNFEYNYTIIKPFYLLSINNSSLYIFNCTFQ